MKNKKCKTITYQEFKKMTEDERKKLNSNTIVEIMESNIYNLVKYARKIEYDTFSSKAQDIIYIAKYYLTSDFDTHSYGINSPQKDKVLNLLNAVVKNYISIQDITCWSEPTETYYTCRCKPTVAYYLKNKPSGKYTLDYNVPTAIENKLKELKNKILDKIDEDRSLNTSTAKQIYNDLNNLEL